MSRLFRRLDERLRIDHRGRSEWVWAGPIGTLVGSVALVCAVGVTSGVGPAVYVPIAALVAVMMTGMSIAYMTPMSDDEPPDDRRRSESSGPLAPPSWYAHLGRRSVPEPAAARPRRRRPREVARPHSR